MARDKSILTTGQVARICGVATRTVGKWFDSGRLKGFRIPGSLDRRVAVDDLAAFMRKEGFPEAMIPRAATVRLLAVGARPHDGFEASGHATTYAPSAFDAGAAFAGGAAVVVVDLDLGRIEAGMIAACVSAKGVPCIALTTWPPHEVMIGGFCGVVSPALSAAEMASAIRECVEAHAKALRASGRRAS